MEIEEQIQSEMYHSFISEMYHSFISEMSMYMSPKVHIYPKVHVSKTIQNYPSHMYMYQNVHIP